MPKTTPTEWLLARLTTPDRAAVIMGDLTEMAASRSRLWFWTAYVRTLVSLGWRTPVAFLCACWFCTSHWVFTALHASMHWLFRWVPPTAPAHGMPLEIRLQLLVIPLYGLAFLLPFLLVRYGLRDRFTRLALVLYLATLPTDSNRLVGLSVMEALAAIVVLVALCLPGWRRPLAVLALCLAPRFAFFEVIQYSVLHGHRMLFGAQGYFVGFAWEFILPAALCLWLHRLLLRNRSAIA